MVDCLNRKCNVLNHESRWLCRCHDIWRNHSLFFKAWKLGWIFIHNSLAIKIQLHRTWRKTQCCEEGRLFKSRDTFMYPTINFKATYTYATQLVSLLYVDKSSLHLKVSWVKLIHAITKDGTIFNWETILSHTLGEAIKRVKSCLSTVQPEFYMSSYLLDASNSFKGMGWA